MKSYFSETNARDIAYNLLQTILSNPTHTLPNVTAAPADKGAKHAAYINALFDGIYKHLSEAKDTQ